LVFEVSHCNIFNEQMIASRNIIHLARHLRKNQTRAERILWQELRDRRFEGLKFLRQHPFIHGARDGRLLFFIADFYCAQKSLVIELDGNIHDFQKEYDYQRDLLLKMKGLEILRIKNEELKDMEAVKEKIRDCL